MSYPMMENPYGDFCFLNGRKVMLSSQEGKSLMNPVDDMVYYESIRVQGGVLLFFENHMLRLIKSVEAKENFPVDTEAIYDAAMRMLKESDPSVTEGNIRIAVTHEANLIHFSHVFYPPEEFYRDGIATAILAWERVDPQVKVLRGDYKSAVAETMAKPTPFGLPYEVLLADREGRITEGGRSNFFVLYKGVVYSPPESFILIGITRRYVLQSVREAGLEYREGMFTLDELVRMRDSSESEDSSVALFVTSSPFDVLPVRSVGCEVFSSAKSSGLRKLSDAYQRIVNRYIESRSTDQVSS